MNNVSNYLHSSRVEEIISREENQFSLKEFNSIKNKAQSIIYLAKIYSCNSEISLNNLDYRNLKTIFYMLSYKDFEVSRIKERREKANELLDKVKSCPSNVCKEVQKVVRKFL